MDVSQLDGLKWPGFDMRPKWRLRSVGTKCGGSWNWADHIKPVVWNGCVVPKTDSRKSGWGN